MRGRGKWGGGGARQVTCARSRWGAWLSEDTDDGTEETLPASAGCVGGREGVHKRCREVKESLCASRRKIG